jgi:drug/metabolite transporter (DMT)-like permease
VPTNFLLLLIVSLAWASDYLFIGWADRALPPLAVGATMASIAALALMLVVRLVLRRPLLPMLRAAPLAPLVLGATAVALPRFCTVYAEESITPDIAALTGTSVPILTLLATMFVTRETAYSHLRILGILVALLGLVVFVGLGDGRSEATGTTTLAGMLVMMAGGLAFVFSGLYSAAKAAALDKAVLTAWVMAVGALLLAVPALLLEAESLAMPSAAALGSLAASGLVSMALAYLLYFVLIERAGAGFAALYAYLIPPLGLLLGVLVLGQPLTLEHLGGLALVLCGLWMITRPAAPRAAASGASLG